MAVTLVELRTRVRSRIALPTDDELVTNSEIDRAINDALQAMAGDFDFPWLQKVTSFVTVAGTQAYALPADLARLQVAFSSSTTINGFVMQARNYAFTANMLSTQPGMPSDFCIIANQVYLTPIPDDIYTVNLLYTTTETALSADGDICLCPEAYSDMVVTYACFNLAIRLQDMNRFNMFAGLKKDWLTRVANHSIKSSTPPAIVLRTDY